MTFPEFIDLCAKTFIATLVLFAIGFGVAVWFLGLPHF